MVKNTDSEVSLKEPTQRPGKPGGKRDRNRKERLKVLSESALALFLDAGIQATTIGDITKEAKVAKGSFYRYFEDKYALVRFLFTEMHHTLDELLRNCADDLQQAGSDYEGMIQAYTTLGMGIAAYLFANPKMFQLYIQESRSPRVGPTQPVREISDLIDQRAIEITRQAHQQKLLRPFPAEVSALSVVGACEKLLCAQLDGVSLGDPIILAQSVSSLVLDGLRASKEAQTD